MTASKPARKRLSSYATLQLMTRPPVFEHSSIDDFKRWKQAFDELVQVHDALLAEVADLRELLGEAKDLLDQCREAGERGHFVDVGELRQSVLAIEAELG